MNLIAHLDAKDAFREQHYCPACKSRLDADDMDLSGEYADLQAVKAKYGAPICWACADNHLVTHDGVLMPREAAIYSAELDAYFSGDEALWRAEADADADDADRRMYAGWR